MYQLPSDVDAAFMSSLGWSELTRRTCNSITEGMMYVGELVEHANDTRSSACQDLREGKALREQLQATIDEMKVTHAKELLESQARGDELLKEKQELVKEKQELQRLTEDHAKENQRLKEESKNARAEAAQIRRELKDTKAQHASEASTFKEEFLKAEEFNDICAPKAYHFLEVGFEGAVHFFKAQGYPPPGAPTDFIDIEGFIASLPLILRPSSFTYVIFHLRRHCMPSGHILLFSVLLCFSYYYATMDFMTFISLLLRPFGMYELVFCHIEYFAFAFTASSEFISDAFKSLG
ncbi:uncharacterized protein LOC142538754 [Primulina tabacum]|uniref:uncharacterized protein LOC142538754 n=1 Tax=Primulina tabacum TaxID=48773 RepID=UPI003F59C96E